MKSFGLSCEDAHEDWRLKIRGQPAKVCIEMLIKTLTITELHDGNNGDDNFQGYVKVMSMMMMSRSCQGDTKVGVEGRCSGEWNADTHVCLNGTQTELLVSTV